MNKTKKILLIAPATEFGAYPPLGLISIASFIKEKGHDVAVICSVQERQMEGESLYEGLKIFKNAVRYFK